MTDGERAASAEEAKAKADLSQAQTDSKTSDGASDGEQSFDLDSRFGETVKDLETRIEQAKREAQSTKDKEFANIRKELTQLKTTTVALHDIIRQQSASSAPPSRGNEDAGEASALVQEMFVLAGVAQDTEAVANSPEYISFFAANGGKADVAKAAGYLKALKSRQSTPSAAAIAQPAGDKTPDPDKVQEYTREMVAARGNPGELRRIKAKYRSDGLDVDNVGFNF